MRRLFPPLDLSTVLERDVVGDEPGSAHGGAELTEEELVHEYRYPDHVSWLRANMVASLDGVASLQGLSEGLSGPADKRVFILLRALADVVLVGAGTARAENYAGVRVPERFAGLRASLDQAPTPPVALVSRNLGLDPGARVFVDTAARPMVITCASAPADRQAALSEVADLVVAGDTEVDPAVLRSALEGRGMSRMLCEGGPSLLHDLIDASVLDELCLTTSPLVAGGGERHLLNGQPLRDPRRSHLSGLIEDEGVLLARYVLER